MDYIIEMCGITKEFPGIIANANRMPFAIRMVAAGKMNPLHAPKPVPGIESVRKLYEFSQKMEKEV